MKFNSKSTVEQLLNDDSFKNWVKETNQNDIDFWETRIKKNPELIDDIYTAKAMILGISFNKNDVSPDKIDRELEKVMTAIENRVTMSTIQKKIVSIRTIKQVSAFAAVGLLCLFLSISFLNPSKEVIHRTAFGEIINLKLPDGTKIVLNGNSEIRYMKDEPRMVSLKGEGYFKVKSMLSTKTKFWVKTDDLTIEVYGTEFNVNNRDDKTNVVLDEGSIHILLKNGDSRKMVPGEFVSYSNENNLISHEKVSESLSYTSWKEGTYIFNNTRLKDVMKHIENTYGLSSEFIDKELENEIITGGVPNENLELCLLAIEKSTGIKIVKENTNLIIYN